ncbi:hypothetical protein K2173_012594 [Erythroxylum novogranatense]|uniref:Uncharacterized protein n=1 Tax=Erythroxylum novogranatense TaxID=1862640 RepID=A0AAV8T259_9ROSI|nr:hypothetical protein K2173_012594 [Erythroxylum novogranatense]
MVLKKQYHGFNGFLVPSFPRAPRSSRGRCLLQKNVDDNQICAIELLASLAGKLLEESESSSASSIASEANKLPAIRNDAVKLEQGEDTLLKKEYVDLGSCEESVYTPVFASQNGDRKFLLKESQNNANNSILEQFSIITNSDSSDKISKDVKPIVTTNKITREAFPGKLEGGSPDPRESCGCNVDSRFCKEQQANALETGGLANGNTSNPKDPMGSYVKFPALNILDRNTQSPSCRVHVPNSSFRCRNYVKLGIRDDDENFSHCSKSITKGKAFRPPSRIGDRRIRKLLTSKYWKIAPKLRDYEHSRVALDGVKPLCHKRKLSYSRGSYQHENLHKRRKFSKRGLIIASDGGFSSESVCNSPEKGINRDKNGSSAMFLGANGVSSPVAGHQSSNQSEDSHVKLNIKSFRIPELYFEVPETATVGHLKRTIMEAVTAAFGGGLHVELLFHEKKVRDDNRTLLQTGITSDENLNGLGFSLEPTPAQASTLVCNDDPPSLLPFDIPQPISRSPASPVLDSGISDMLADPPPPLDPNKDIESNIESNHESVSSHTDILTDTTVPDCSALVAIPQMSAEAISAVPINQKPRRTAVVKRRTRRPFSVSEVEALVSAVEELGTGRWRDVKLRSFENANHRTYVDLKDKWKTLVHTAKIAPQQRRGEPVPQELLDRVLAAHAYWSQLQSKQHSKNEASTLNITDAPAI